VLPMLSGSWWALAVRGLAAIIFGILAFVLPEGTLFALILLFGAYSLVDGVFAVVAAIRGSGRRWLLLAEGILGILAGLVTLVLPGLTAFVLLYIIAFWAIFTGIARIVLAISLRREIDNEWFLILSGALTVLFGVLLVFLPDVGLLSILWLVGIWAVIIGVMLLTLAFRVRGMGRRTNRRVD
jgi:uncharacterized membrane protein HdeD (DUF308 family)